MMVRFDYEHSVDRSSSSATALSAFEASERRIREFLAFERLPTDLSVSDHVDGAAVTRKWLSGALDLPVLRVNDLNTRFWQHLGQ
jgi:hypothetical protein